VAFHNRIDPRRARFIRTEARKLTIQFWRRNKKFYPGPNGHLNLLPFEPKLIAEGVLGLSFDEPWELGFSNYAGALQVELAGQLDRPNRQISIARKFSAEIRRFTAAHEIGHFILHRERNLFRESPLTDPAIWRPATRPELEANIFAAELLMPSKILRDLFVRRFPAPIDVCKIDDNDAVMLTNGHLMPSELRAKPLQEIAEIVANASSFVSGDQRTLTDIFGVSRAAMGIQFRDLGLIRRSA
jgi:hypothetical protein